MLTTFFVNDDAAAGGDGTSNSPFHTIQLAIDAAALNAGDDIVQIMSGTYDETLSVNDTSGALTIIGATGNRSDVVIRNSTNSALQINSINIDGSKNVTIRNVTFQAGDAVSQGGYRGIWYHDSLQDGAPKPYSLTVDNVLVQGHEASGISVERAGALTVSDTISTDNKNGVYVSIATDVLLINVDSSGNHQDGIQFHNGNSLDIRDSSFDDNARYGSYIRNIPVVDVSVATFSGNVDRGFYIYSGNSQFTADTISANDNGGVGLAINLSTSQIEISDGQFNGNAYQGLLLPTIASANLDQLVVLNNNTANLTDVGGGGIFVTSNIDGATLSLTNSLIQGNVSVGHGAGIYASGTVGLFVEDTIITGNRTSNTANGGGIYVNSRGSTSSSSTQHTIRRTQISNNEGRFGGGLAYVRNGLSPLGTMVIEDSIISENVGREDGGGIYHLNQDLTILRSTIHDNSMINAPGGQRGAGLYLAGETFLHNSTVSGNYSPRSGSGIAVVDNASNQDNVFRVDISFSTITDNQSGGFGGGIYQTGVNNTVRLFASIVADNRANDGSPDYRGRAFSGGGNLIGNGTGITWIPSSSSDLVGTGTNPINPMLGALANNGGITPTHALLAGSPAINAITDSSFNTTIVDQRGIGRPQGSGRDIGAFELEAPGPQAFDQVFSTAEDATLNSFVSGSAGAEGDATFIIVEAPQHAAEFTLNDDGTFTYIPLADFHGADQFTFRLFDGDAYSNIATATIQISSVNDLPVVVNDSYTTVEETPLVVGGNIAGEQLDQVNDRLAGTSIFYTKLTQYQQHVIAGRDGYLSSIDLYLHSNSRAGAVLDFFLSTGAPWQTDTPEIRFTYTVQDEDINNWITIDVSAASIYLNEGESFFIGSYAGSPGNLFLLATNSDNGDGYQPGSLWGNGERLETFQENDYDLVFRTRMTDSPVIGGVLQNDSDVDGDTLAVTVVQPPQNGTVTLGDGGTFVYIPDVNFVGDDSFTYQANDGHGGTALATVTIAVTSNNDAPVAEPESYIIPEDYTYNHFAKASDVEGDDLTFEVVDGPDHAVAFQLNADGTFSYKPEANYFGDDSFTFRVFDGELYSNTATISFSIYSINDAPVAEDDTYTTAENTALIVGGQGDPDQANEREGGRDNFSLRLWEFQQEVVAGIDGHLQSIEVFIGQNSQAGAILDFFVSKGTAWQTDAPDYQTSYILQENDLLNWVTIDVSAANIYLAAGENFIFGTLPGNPFVYLHATNSDKENGDNYTAGSLWGNAELLQTFQDNDYDFLFRTHMIPTAAGVLLNDTDADGDQLNASVVQGPSHGTLSLNTNGTFTYIPEANFFGQDSFTYQINDGNGRTDTATVTIDVTSVNDAPVAQDDSFSVDEDATLDVSVPGILANDSDIEGDTLSVSLVSDVAHGSLTLNSDGSFVYIPAANFVGEDSFTYEVNDGNGGTDTATVLLTVVAVNDAPVAVDDTLEVDEDQTLTFHLSDLVGNDSDIDEDLLTASLVGNVANGTLTLNPDGMLTYIPNADFYGSDSFTYQVSDDKGGVDIATATINVLPVNDNPVAEADFYTVDEDGELHVSAPGLLANDADVDGDSLTASLVSGVASGRLILNQDGSFIYVPDENFNGQDSFVYNVSDGNGGTDTIEVTITVTPANDSPVGTTDSFALNEDETLNLTVPGVLANDTDIDGDPLTVSLKQDVQHGTLTLNGDGSLTYVPNANYHGTDYFTYTISDGNGGTATATAFLVVASQNDAPIAVDDTFNFVEDHGYLLHLIENDIDVDGDELTVLSVSSPVYGRTEERPAGWIYLPDTNFYGTETLTYVISDGQGETSTGTITINVSPVNDRPVASDDSYSVNEDETLSVAAVGVLDNDTDVDLLDSLTVTLVSDVEHGTLQLNSNGSFTYVPDVDYYGTDAFTYEASDGNGGTDTATVTITVNPVNDAPVATDDSAGTNEDAAVVIDVLSNDSDLDGDSLAVSSVSAPTHGTAVVNTDGTIAYTPVADFHGSDSFTYTISDGNGGTDTATVSITVNPVNDVPVALDDSASTEEGSAVTIAVLANDSDVDGDGLSITTASDPQNGSIQVNADGTITYTPNANFSGSESLTYTISDGVGGVASATIAIEVTTIDAGNDSVISVTLGESGQGRKNGKPVDSSGDEIPVFHEWEAVASYVWLTINEELPSGPLNIVVSMTSSESLFDDPAITRHEGTNATIENTTDGGVRVTTFTLMNVDLSDYELGDRVLVGTLTFDPNTSNREGLSANTSGQYAQLETDIGFSVQDAQMLGEGAFEVQSEVVGQMAPVIYDHDENGQIGIKDLADLLRNIGKKADASHPGVYRFDYDRSGRVSVSDFALFLRHFGISKPTSHDIKMPGLSDTPVLPSSSISSLLEGELTPDASSGVNLVASVPESTVIPTDTGDSWGQSSELNSFELIEPLSLESNGQRDVSSESALDSATTQQSGVHVGQSLDPRLIDAIVEEDDLLGLGWDTVEPGESYEDELDEAIVMMSDDGTATRIDDE